MRGPVVCLEPLFHPTHLANAVVQGNHAARVKIVLRKAWDRHLDGKALGKMAAFVVNLGPAGTI